MQPPGIAQTTVTIGIASLDEAKVATAAFRGEQCGCHLNFISRDLARRVLMPPRWAIVRAIVGKGPLTTLEVARRVGGDAAAVEDDIQALLVAGVLDRAEGGRVVFPYDAIRVDASLAVDLPL